MTAIHSQPTPLGGERPVPPPVGKRKRLVYVCLQQTAQGQASHAHVHEIIAGLTRRGWDVDLREVAADRSRRRGKLYFLWHYLRPQLRLWRDRLREVDAMYIRADALALPAFLWARSRKIPVIQEVNGPYSDRLISKPWLKRFGPMLARLQRFQFKRSAALIAVTPRLVDWLRAEGGTRSVTLVPNGANTELFHPLATTSIVTPEQYVILVGLLARWQGVPLLLKAVADPAWPPDVSVLIAGDGDERPAIEAAARAESRIRYLGVVPYRAVPGLVARSLAGLSLKTDLEGRTDTGMSPLKLYETMACGVPAIVTEYHGQADVVRAHDCGLIVSQTDPAELARAVARVAGSPGERAAWGQRGLAAARHEHSWDSRAAVVDRLIRSHLP